MFRAKDRPAGLEFGCCAVCNQGTKDTDLLACFLARATVTKTTDTKSFEEIRGFYNLLKHRVPELADAFDDDKVERKRMMFSSPVVNVQDQIHIHLDDERIKRYVSAFATKLGMALYAQHVGREIPLEGGVVSFWMTGYGATPDTINETLKILPLYDTLCQGIKVVRDQFEYRFNTDEKSVVAALSNFHNGLYIFTIASGNRMFLDLPEVSLTSALVDTGKLIDYMAGS